MSSKLFRRGRLEDAEGVAHVWVRSWHEAYADLLTGEELAGRTHEYRIGSWRNGFDQEWSSRWVTEVGERIVGFAIGGPTADDDLDPSVTGELQAIYLLAEAHGQGRGKELMERVLADMEGAGLAEASLWVLDGNDPAIGFYECTGWTADGGRKDCFGGADAPALRYRKRLI